MSILFRDWSKDRLAGVGLTTPKADWEHVEEWHSSMGVVQKGEEGWYAKVWITDPRFAKPILVRVKTEFDSAAVAMGVVERVWKREEEKRNG